MTIMNCASSPLRLPRGWSVVQAGVSPDDAAGVTITTSGTNGLLRAAIKNPC